MWLSVVSGDDGEDEDVIMVFDKIGTSGGADESVMMVMTKVKMMTDVVVCCQW